MTEKIALQLAALKVVLEYSKSQAKANPVDAILYDLDANHKILNELIAERETPAPVHSMESFSINHLNNLPAGWNESANGGFGGFE